MSDIVALTIALTVSVGLVISTAVANHRLTEKVRQLRQQLHNDGSIWQQEVNEAKDEADHYRTAYLRSVNDAKGLADHYIKETHNG
jgi:multidrug resistance efflux pump